MEERRAASADTPSGAATAKVNATGAARWSRLNLDWLEDCLSRPEGRLRSTFASIHRDNPLAILPLQSWPLFADVAAMEELGRIAVAMDSLFKSVPERFFGRDAARVQKFYRFPNPALAALLMAEPTGIDGAMGRGDYLHTADGLRCIEYNAGNGLGGFQCELLEEVYLSHPGITRFLTDRGLEAKHWPTLETLFRNVTERAVVAGTWRGGSLNTAVVIYPDDPGQVALHSETAYRRAYHRALEAGGRGIIGDLFLCGFDDLREVAGGLAKGQDPIHAVIAMQNATLDPRVFRQAKASRVDLYSGPVGELLSDKRNLALLSEHASTSRFDDRERRLIEEHIPWTRQVAPGSGEFRGRSGYLPDLIADHREEMVLKEANSLAGKKVHIGRFTSAQIWEDVLERALLEGSWIVQELQTSYPYLLQTGEDEVAAHDLVLGPFVFGGVFGGAFLRVQRRGEGGIVNTAQGAETAILLGVEAAAS